MTDIKSSFNPLFLREEDLRQGIELLYFAYRDFTAEPDAILAEYGFGRAHHRVIHFVGGNPRINVSDLLAILKITQLVREEFIVQHEGPHDRRQRLLELTPKGVALERRLSESQRRRFADAYRAAGAEAVDGYRKVLMGMISEEDRERRCHAQRYIDADRRYRLAFFQWRQTAA